MPCGHPEWMHTGDGCQGWHHSDGDSMPCACEEYGLVAEREAPLADWNPADTEGAW